MSQFSALSYKNWILYKRSLCCNCCEIFIPILFILFVVMVRRLAPIVSDVEQQFYQNNNYTFTIAGTPALAASLSIPRLLKNCPTSSLVAIFPTSDPLYGPISSTLAPLYNLTSYASEAVMEAYIRSPAYSTSPSVCFAVILNSVGTDYSYKLRFNVSAQAARTDGPATDALTTLKTALDLILYRTTINRGMPATSNLINTAILQTITPSVFVNQMAPVYQEAYIQDPIYTYLGNSFGIITLLPIILIYLRITATMLGEKEKKIRESMSIMGMTLKAYYGTWLMRYTIVMWITHAICSAIISFQLKQIPFYVPFVIFALFDLVAIIQNFFIMVFFTRAKIGVLIALLFYVLQYVISFLVSTTDLTLNNKLSIIPHAAFVLAFQTMLYSASVQTPVTFTQLINGYTIQSALISFAVNIVVYLLLLWYVEQVVPNEWGAKKHPFFCCVKKEQIHPVEEQKNEYVQSVNEKNKADEQENKTLIVQALCKDYDEVTAVKNLSLTMYKDQIFVLLGHNGAGKTTTISMLTGMIQPTSGAINVCGETELDKIREMIGVCPQHDTLYDQLTVEEHLSLYATFKGDGDTSIDTLIQDVNLQEKREEYAMNLSGGQKRRLSVAIAFVGGSKVIVLDEPTSGMDTSARRYIWELLKNYKNDRIILLTTHFMDEADYLGDRIAIMGAGKLQCCGSTVYLKNKFGVGYTITFVKEERATSKEIINLVSKHIPHCKVLSDVSAELSLQLPLQQVGMFPKLFDEIDSRKKELKVLEYGISITTLEEVFLKVAQKAEKIDHTDEDNESPAIKNSSIINLPKNSPLIDASCQNLQTVEIKLQREKGCCIVGLRHFFATFLKRLRVIKRDYKSFVFQLILPLAIILVAMFLLRISFVVDLPSQTINSSLYTVQQSPIVMPIGSTDPTFLASIGTALTTKYGASISLQTDNVDVTPATFDKNFVFPLKNTYLRGGLFFNPVQTISGTSVYSFVTLANTRTPTSALFLPTLAAEAIINTLGTPVTITLINSPLPRSYAQLQINNTISGFFGSFIFSIALAFKFASVVAFIVKEREDRSKHQQIVSGMRISSYWFANYFYDYILYVVISVVAVGMIMGFDVTAFTSGDNLGATWLLFLLYGLANIPFTYLLGYLFKDYANGQAAIYFLNFILGGLLPILTLLLRILGTDSNPIGRGLAWFFRIFPAFCFGEGLINMGSSTLYSAIENNNVTLTAFQSQIALAPIIYLAVFSLIYMIAVFLVEAAQNSESFMRLFTSEANYTETVSVTDSDVILEAQRALISDPAQSMILTKNLRKVYKSNGIHEYKVAVDNLSFGISKGEVFGLLGVNGAGKTTTFKMLAGQVTSTAGESYFGGKLISKNVDQVRENLGYCPQFDALIDSLTVREQLQLYYDLKSLPAEHKDEMVGVKISQLDLTAYEDKLSGSLSGGNKRKLSVGMALIGNPQILFLDEPSTGMDPKARRFMWKIISRIASEQKQSTVILTTHSMEEAEALSTRLAIMVKGRFQCIGTPQHVKTKYGEGYEIEVKLKMIAREVIEEIISKLNGKRSIKKSELQGLLIALKADPLDGIELSSKGSASYLFNALSEKQSQPIYPIVEFIQINKRVRKTLEVISKELGNSILLETLQNFMRLQTKLKVSVGRCFQFMEKNKTQMEIQQYTIKQATVEQIFNKFAEEGDASEANL